MRRWFYSLCAMSLLLAGSSAVGTTAAHATTTQPQKIAVIVMENKDYDAAEANQTHGANYVIGSRQASYINNTIVKESLSIQPNDSTCNYPTGDSAGTGGTEACTAGMFQDYRAASANYRASGSAPEYAYMVMGSDSNVRDTKFPDTLNTGLPNQGVIGYTPNNKTADPAYNILKVLENHSSPFDVYAEDYLGNGSSCDTSRFSDTTTTHLYYARKHNPFLLTWDQSPDANTTKPTVTPSTAPSASLCESHLHNFPNNTPNSSTVPVQNFAGTENFGNLTYIIPSLCHDGHDNDITLCGDNTGMTDPRGGMVGTDKWLSLNYKAIRKDVGQNGVVILTWDENIGTPNTANGLTPPIATFITPGENSSGTPGTLAASGCNPMPSTGCGDSSTIYDHVSTLKAILTAEGSSCSTLDNSQAYQGTVSSTARAYCNAATALPITMTFR